MKIKNNIECKKDARGNEVLTVPFELKNIGEEKQDGEEFFIFEGHGSTFGNVDLVDDIVAPGAFSESIRKNTPVILWQHDRFEPIGMPVEIREDNIGLFLKVRMPKSDTFVSGRVMPQLRLGSIKSMSIGFRVEEFSFDMDTGIRTLLKVDLREVSLVTFPANPEATITSVKSVPDYAASLQFAKRDQEWDSEKAITNIIEFYPTDKTSFMYVEGDEKQLPFVDVINGKKYIIPKALIEIRQILSGSKGKLDIPPDSKKQIASIVEKYIARLNDEQPKKVYTGDDIKNFTAREIEKCLRESDIFSKDAAVLIASKHNQGEPEKFKEVTNAANKLLEKITAKNNKRQLENKLNSVLKKQRRLYM